MSRADTTTQGLATRLVHAGEAEHPYGSVTVPVFDSAAFVMPDLAAHDLAAADLSAGPYYTRGYNPTVDALERKLAAVEQTEDALAFNSGMAAITTTLLSLLRGGGHVVASDELFVATARWLAEDLDQLGGRCTFADFADLDEVGRAIRPDTRALFFEEFTNPSLRVLDLPALIELGQAHALTVVVDNTLASPVLLRPAEYGADLVVHSATKYLAGHGRVLAGAVAGRAGLVADIRELRRRLGTDATPHNAAGVLDGMKTLQLRVHRQSSSALLLATLAAEHPATRTVNYPGLAGSHGHAVAAALTDGRYGGMFSVTLRDPGTKAAVYNGFEVITRATSLGDVASLVDSYDVPDLLRFSVGIEDPADLAADLSRALDLALDD
ncbi:MAG: cystathionine gamma-synthase [Pseudonocardiales bacterium]|jgi:cystathionine beta-lyase/cystathionine gamma-synthase|nr:cystathionine gamma-synthase [Pseudonocardiales bacterium]MDT7775180.1 cystathionine gamma-synthase [Pseudonocardiales bacterium]